MLQPTRGRLRTLQAYNYGKALPWDTYGRDWDEYKHPVPMSRLECSAPDLLYHFLMCLGTEMNATIGAANFFGHKFSNHEWFTISRVLETMERIQSLLTVVPQWVTWQTQVTPLMGRREFVQHRYVENGENDRGVRKMNVGRGQGGKELMADKKITTPHIKPKEPDNRKRFEVQRRIEAPRINKKRKDNRKIFKAKKKPPPPPCIHKQVRDNRPEFKAKKKYEVLHIEAKRKGYTDVDEDERPQYSDNDGSSSEEEERDGRLLLMEKGEKGYVDKTGSSSDDDTDDDANDDDGSNEISEGDETSGYDECGRQSQYHRSPSSGQLSFFERKVGSYRHSVPSKSSSDYAYNCGTFGNQYGFNTTTSAYDVSTYKDFDPYDVLGLSAGKRAPQGEVKQAWCALKKEHPDKLACDATKSQKERAHERWIDITRAKNILCDPRKRKVFDRTGDVEEAEKLGISSPFDSDYDDDDHVAEFF